MTSTVRTKHLSFVQVVYCSAQELSANKKPEGQDSSQILLNITDEKTRPREVTRIVSGGGSLEPQIWAPESMFITSWVP